MLIEQPNKLEIVEGLRHLKGAMSCTSKLIKYKMNALYVI
jgi:hypothetical protein